MQFPEKTYIVHTFKHPNILFKIEFKADGLRNLHNTTLKQIYIYIFLIYT